MDVGDWFLAEQRTILVQIFVQKGLKVLFKLSTSIKLKWSHPGDIAWSVNHRGATRQLMGTSIFGNHGKNPFQTKIQWCLWSQREKERLASFFFKDSSKNLQDQIHYSYKTNCSWPQHGKQTYSEAFNREFFSHSKACKIPERYLGNIILTTSIHQVGIPSSFQLKLCSVVLIIVHI